MPPVGGIFADIFLMQILRMSLESCSDEELMARFCVSQDGSVFRELMTRHHGKALGYIQRKVFCRQLAEEIVPDAFVRVVRNRDAFDPAQKFTSWFYVILKPSGRCDAATATIFE